ncbi:hypothetical protein TIFTF001_015454 [Ficus carica]|uniref:Uncharacterized protein n=1 Tax=Ficus carica TaxID=3494 RepID=A0AA87ZYR1_FICCA|nr:hypothetical protein TIFTF001_015454 [Ficus carica]
MCVVGGCHRGALKFGGDGGGVQGVVGGCCRLALELAVTAAVFEVKSEVTVVEFYIEETGQVVKLDLSNYGRKGHLLPITASSICVNLDGSTLPNGGDLEVAVGVLLNLAVTVTVFEVKPEVTIVELSNSAHNTLRVFPV